MDVIIVAKGSDIKQGVNMQEPIIQKILNLAKYTFARQPSSKRGCRQRILEPDAFSDHVSELVNLVKQVSNKIVYIFFTNT